MPGSISWAHINLSVVHSCEEISWKRPLHRKKPNLFVVIRQDGQVQRTAAKRTLAPQWDHLCNFSSDSAITLQLWHDSLLPCKDVCLGVAKIEEPLNVTNFDTEFTRLPLTGEDQKAKGNPTGILLVRFVHNIETAPMAIEHAQQDVQKLTQSSDLAEKVENYLGFRAIACAWQIRLLILTARPRPSFARLELAGGRGFPALMSTVPND
ncbi:hypothetical protein DFH06DRAFT_1474755 [Mycena polygramma]|nr:hypothetical protein DFH06DRAFT_1474755 [Mycena polygramma]